MGNFVVNRDNDGNASHPAVGNDRRFWTKYGLGCSHGRARLKDTCELGNRKEAASTDNGRAKCTLKTCNLAATLAL